MQTSVYSHTDSHTNSKQPPPGTAVAEQQQQNHPLRMTNVERLLAAPGSSLYVCVSSPTRLEIRLCWKLAATTIDDDDDDDDDDVDVVVRWGGRG
ncbi:hypothetical protein V1477_011824 [Vespula maculifrons]|uniref:Uncharacterized protein n=1 Tax=Vespula maculifrons TaxID=7453 RepID=A0ABD2C0D2_VESMC